MPLSNCELCRHLTLKPDDQIDDLQHRVCAVQPAYASLFNLLKLDTSSSQFTQFIVDCPRFSSHTAFAQWRDMVDAEIARQHNGKTLCDLYPLAVSRRDAIFRTYYESPMSKFAPVEIASLIINDCLQTNCC